MSDALLGVIIGGAIAILPPMFTIIIQTINENKKEKKKNKQLAYDKIVRYLYKIYNCNLKTTKIEDIYMLTEEVSVLSTMYCNSEIQNAIKVSSDLFGEYVKCKGRGNERKIKEAKEKLKQSNRVVRRLISKDMGNK